MKKSTKRFLNLIFEREESKDSKEKQDKGKKPSKESDQSALDALPIFNQPTSNKISAGRPISDPGLANIRHRAEAGSKEAAELLNDIGIKGVSGNSWFEQTEGLFRGAASGELGALINGANIVKSPAGKPGVKVDLSPNWTDDEKGGKRSYGFIRSLIIAAMKTGKINIAAKQRRKLRIEIVEGNNQAVVYISNKAMSWVKK